MVSIPSIAQNKSVVFRKQQLSALFEHWIGHVLFKIGITEFPLKYENPQRHRDLMDKVVSSYFRQELSIHTGRIRVVDYHGSDRLAKGFLYYLASFLIHNHVDVNIPYRFEGYDPITVLQYIGDEASGQFCQHLDESLGLHQLFSNPFMEYRMIETPFDLIFIELQDYRIRRYYEEVANGTITA